MKKLALSTLIVPLIFALASCESSPSHNFLQTQDDAFAPNIAYLVLGKNGLYNGEKGENIAELFLENTVVYSGAPGDALPSADAITSTSSDVVFETWIRYDGEGKPTPYSKVPNDSNAILYAFYSYDGDLNAGDGSATTGGGGGEIGQDDEYYVTGVGAFMNDYASWSVPSPVEMETFPSSDANVIEQYFAEVTFDEGDLFKIAKDSTTMYGNFEEDGAFAKEQIRAISDGYGGSNAEVLVAGTYDIYFKLYADGGDSVYVELS